MIPNPEGMFCRVKTSVALSALWLTVVVFEYCLSESFLLLKAESDTETAGEDGQGADEERGGTLMG